jgi:hypothetical protein
MADQKLLVLADGDVVAMPVVDNLGNYLRRDGSLPMTGALELAGDAEDPLDAVPLQQVEALLEEVGGGGSGLQAVTTDETLTGDGTPENPLSVVGGGGGGGAGVVEATPNTLVARDDTGGVFATALTLGAANADAPVISAGGYGARDIAVTTKTGALRLRNDGEKGMAEVSVSNNDGTPGTATLTLNGFGGASLYAENFVGAHTPLTLELVGSTRATLSGGDVIVTGGGGGTPQDTPGDVRVTATGAISLQGGAVAISANSPGDDYYSPDVNITAAGSFIAQTNGVYLYAGDGDIQIHTNYGGFQVFSGEGAELFSNNAPLRLKSLNSSVELRTTGLWMGHPTTNQTLFQLRENGGSMELMGTGPSSIGFSPQGIRVDGGMNIAQINLTEATVSLSTYASTVTLDENGTTLTGQTNVQALSLYDGENYIPVQIGEDGTGPGGVGRALYIA